MPDKLPEEFAPTGPKLSRFPIQPAPPVRPRLFPDEARFAFRLALICAGTEFIAWSWLGANAGYRSLIVLAALRLLKPLWTAAGTRLPRTFLAAGLLVASLAGIAMPIFLFGRLPYAIAIIAAGLPALADLCATAVGDAIT